MMITVYFALRNMNDNNEQAPGLPVVYRGRIVGLIKKALELAAIEYQRELYTGDVPKNFSFCVYPVGTYTTRQANVQINQNLSLNTRLLQSSTGLYQLTVSSVDPFFIVMLENGFLLLKRYNTVFPFSLDNYMTVDNTKIGIVVEKIIVAHREELSDKATFRILSPVVLSTPDGKPVTYNDASFEQVLNDSARYKMQKFFGRDLLKPLIIEDMNMKTKAVQIIEVKEPKPVIKLLCSDGVITLRGHKDDLNLLYRMGLGMKTGYGFGMLKVV